MKWVYVRTRNKYVQFVVFIIILRSPYCSPIWLIAQELQDKWFQKTSLMGMREKRSTK